MNKPIRLTISESTQILLVINEQELLLDVKPTPTYGCWLTSHAEGVWFSTSPAGWHEQQRLDICDLQGSADANSS